MTARLDLGNRRHEKPRFDPYTGAELDSHQPWMLNALGQRMPFSGERLCTSSECPVPSVPLSRWDPGPLHWQCEARARAKRAAEAERRLLAALEEAQ